MKIAELVSGLRYMVTNEQLNLIDRLKKNDNLDRHDLEEREQEIMEQLTRSGIVNRKYNEETKTISYSLPRR
jgi:hypothetical protein